MTEYDVIWTETHSARVEANSEEDAINVAAEYSGGHNTLDEFGDFGVVEVD